MQVVSLVKCGEREEVEEKGKRRDEGLQFICFFFVLYCTICLEDLYSFCRVILYICTEIKRNESLLKLENTFQ